MKQNTLDLYAHYGSKALLQRYLEMNRITHFSILNEWDRGNPRGWSVWEMTGGYSGFTVKIFKRKKDALGYANQLSQLTGLPVV